MTGSVHDPVLVTSVDNQPPRKMLLLLKKRLRQLMWILIGTGSVIAVLGGVFAIWWLTSLNRLPDIGDPFDVAEFRKFQIPDEQNAIAWFRRARANVTPMPELPRAINSGTATVAWSKADPKLREWVEINRAALTIFKKGADLQDGISHPVGEPYSAQYNVFNSHELVRLAFLEGSRLEENGDTAGAWDCYRAVLRMIGHLRRRGDSIERWSANTVDSPLRQRLATWVTNPKTTIPQLRRALDEVIENQPRPEWNAFGLKQSYFDMVRLLDRSVDHIHRALGEGTRYRIGDYEIPTDIAVHFYGYQRFLMREPERSRRVIKLIFANWLAHAEVPELRENRPAVRAVLASTNYRGSVLLYRTSPEAPPAARALPPETLARWVITTLDAKPFLTGNFWSSVHVQELRNHRELVLLLAEELFKRERGKLPESEQDLVGPYLKILPDDGSAELDDGTALIIGDSPAAGDTPPR